MKKTLAIILIAVITLLSLASCDTVQSIDGKTAEEALLIVASRMSEENALKTNLVFNIQMMVQGVPSSVDINASISSKQVGNELLLEGDMGITTLGFTIPTSYQIVDGVLYLQISIGPWGQRRYCAPPNHDLLDVAQSASKPSREAHFQHHVSVPQPEVWHREQGLIL